MGNSSPPSTQTTTQVSKPPAYVEPKAIDFLNRADSLSHLPFSTYQGERISPLTPTHNFALNAGRQSLATQLPIANNTMTNFAGGGFNSPAYIHPWVGPSVPGIGMSHPYGMGMGGKGGRMASQPGPGTGAPSASAPTPIPEAPFFPTQAESSGSTGGVPNAPMLNPMTGAPMQQNEFHDPAQTGDMAYYNDLGSFLSNARGGPGGAIGQIISDLATGAPNTPFDTVPQNFAFNHDNPSYGVDQGMGFQGGFEGDDLGAGQSTGGAEL